MENKVILMFGGSFNPPLYSHFSLAQQVLNEFHEIEKIVFVPVNCKYQKQGLIENEHRFAMLQLGCNQNEAFAVSSVEISSLRYLHTIETLELLQKEYPNHTLWFMIGSDNLKELRTWQECEKLVTTYNVLVLERDQDHMEEIIQSDPFLSSHMDRFYKISFSLRTNLSSTYVRKLLAQHNSIRYLTTDNIIQYINDHRLYEGDKLC